MVQIVLIWPSSICSSEWRGIISITSAVWSTSRLSTRAVTFHALHVTLRKYYQEPGVSFHCYADDTQLYISSQPGKTHQIEKLTECIVYIKNWMTSNFLLLNSEKTEVLIIGPITPTCNNLEYCLTLDGCSVNSSSSVRNLGVLFDNNLSFDSHVSSICKTAYFHLKSISKLRPMLSKSNAEMLIHAFMASRLDYCNALLGGCSARLINKLQMVQNSAARVLTRTRKYDHISAFNREPVHTALAPY